MKTKRLPKTFHFQQGMLLNKMQTTIKFNKMLLEKTRETLQSTNQTEKETEKRYLAKTRLKMQLLKVSLIA